MEKELPKNWVRSNLQDVTKNVKGKKPKIQSEVEFEGSVPYMDIKALEYNEIRQFADIESSKHFEEGDIAMVWDGARSGWVSKTNYGAIGSTLVAFKPIKINSNYLFYYLLEKYPFINSNARGVGIPHVDPTILWSLDFPLPPLPEQNRIVAKLDTLFGQVEEIKTSMAKIPHLLKDFRQQVLTQAVTGKLTEEWRKGKELGEWENVTIENLVNSLKKDIRTGPFGSALKKEEHKNEGVPVWGIESIGLNGKFTGFNKIYVTREKANTLKSFEVKGGNIMISRSGTVGELCILPDDIEYGLISTNLMKIILNNDVIVSKYFCWLFKGSPIVIDKLNDLCKGSTRLFLTQTILKNLDFPLPPIEEQQEIVSRVESLFAKVDAIEKQYEILKAKIDSLPQAILHKAFKGELSQQLDSDGDARELLREIQALKTTKGKKTLPTSA